MSQPSVLDTANEVAALAGPIAIGEARNLAYRLSSGVVVRIKPVPPLAIREAAIQGEPPKPPMAFNKDREREEPNPLDPDYAQALEDYQIRQFYRVADVLMMLGVEIEEIPDGTHGPDSDDWVEMMEAAGVRVPEFRNKYARQLSWIRLYAARTDADISVIMSRVIALSGVTEVDVQRAAASFLRSEER